MMLFSTKRIVATVLCLAIVILSGCGRAAEQQKKFKLIRSHGGKIELHGFGPEIAFSNVKISDEDLACVTPLGHVHKLTLEFVPITDQGLDHILALDRLGEVDFKQTKITEEGIKKLEQKFPDLVVTHR